jgi:outer membrane receptor for ferrienterochelin and colicins
MKKLFYLFVLINSYEITYAQQREIKGRVTDKETLEPLPGATIAIKKTNVAVASDKDGLFIISNLPSGNFILVINYVGYKTSELSINFDEVNNNIIDVRLSTFYKSSDSIVISASRRPEKITDAPASIHVIGQKELQQFSGSNVGELAANVQGVEFVRMGVDNVSFNARGLNNAFNGKVFQMIDGRNSMNPLSGSLMMGNNMSVNKEDIEKVEVLLGPQAALYGPNVHNALFNFITKDPRIYQGTTLSVSRGNQNQFSARIRQGEKINSRWAYKLTGEYAVGKDFDFRDSIRGVGGGPNQVFGPIDTIAERIDLDFRRLRGEAHLYYNLTPGSTIIVTTGGSKSNTINTTTGGHNQFVGLTNYFVQARYTSPRFYATVYNAWANFGRSYGVTSYTREFYNRTHSRLFDKNHKDYATLGHLSAEEADVYAKNISRVRESPKRLNAEVQYNYTFQKQQLFVVAGLTYQEDKPKAYGITLVDSFQKIYVTQIGAVLQFEKSLPWNMRLIGAGRLDNHSNFGNFFSPKIALVKSVGAGNFRITWGQANSMPSILYQYAKNGNFFGNGGGIIYIPNGVRITDTPSFKTTTPLLPEKVSTWEVGYKGNFFNKLNVDVSYYNGISNNFFTPSIQVQGRAIYVGNTKVTHPPSTAGVVDSNTNVLSNARFSTIFNFGDVKVYGVDAGVNYQFNNIVNLAVKYSWLGSNISDSSSENDANGDGHVLADERSLNSPKSRLTASLNFENLIRQKGFINISARYVEKYDFYSGNQISTKAGEGKWGIVEGPGGIPRYPKNFDRGPLGGTTVDIRAGYRLNEMVSFTLGITNLFDAKVREFAGSSYIRRLYQAEVRVHVPNKK